MRQLTSYNKTGLHTQAQHLTGLLRAPVFLALLSVVMFSGTVPLTKQALKAFSPEFIASSRVFLAAILALSVVNFQHFRAPNRNECVWLLISGLGVVVGFPFLLNLGLTNLKASEMGVVLAGLPLCTAIVATIVLRETHRTKFWGFSVLGALCLIGFFYKGMSENEWHFKAVLLLTCIILSAGIGYACGAKVAKTLGGWPTICWTLVLYLPVSTVLFAYYTYKEWTSNFLLQFNADTVTSMLAVGYLVMVSQLYGFKFWYQAMAQYGAGKIAQLQLLMPFSTLLLAVFLLNEQVSLNQLFFLLLISCFVFLSIKSK